MGKSKVAELVTYDWSEKGNEDTLLRRSAKLTGLAVTNPPSVRFPHGRVASQASHDAHHTMAGKKAFDTASTDSLAFSSSSHGTCPFLTALSASEALR